MSKKVLALIALACVFFVIPLFSGISVPRTLEPKDLGGFLGSVVRFWLDVIKYAAEKASLSCRG